MYSSKTAMTMLSKMLRDWADAIDKGDVALANQLARSLPQAAELVTVHPEFMRHYSEACPDLKPETALEYMSRLLLSATKAQGEVTQKVYTEASKRRMHASDPAHSQDTSPDWRGDGEPRRGGST